MSDALWLGPLVSGLVFGLLFAYVFPVVLRRIGGPEPNPGFTPARNAVTGLLAGVLFGALIYLDKLAGAGIAGPGWSWFLTATKWFGLVAAIGGLVLIVARWRTKA